MPILVMLFKCGLRRGEFLGLHVDLGNGPRQSLNHDPTKYFFKAFLQAFRAFFTLGALDSAFSSATVGL